MMGICKKVSLRKTKEKLRQNFNRIAGTPADSELVSPRFRYTVCIDNHFCTTMLGIPTSAEVPVPWDSFNYSLSGWKLSEKCGRGSERVRGSLSPRKSA
jgi:hypothetical protein